MLQFRFVTKGGWFKLDMNNLCSKCDCMIQVLGIRCICTLHCIWLMGTRDPQSMWAEDHNKDGLCVSARKAGNERAPRRWLFIIGKMKRCNDWRSQLPFWRSPACDSDSKSRLGADLRILHGAQCKSCRVFSEISTFIFCLNVSQSSCSFTVTTQWPASLCNIVKILFP